MVNLRKINKIVSHITTACHKDNMTKNLATTTEHMSNKIEKKVPVDTIITNYYIPDEIAPFAKRLVNSSGSTMRPGGERVLDAIETTREKLSKIKDLEIKKTFSSLYERIINETTNIENLSGGIITISQKLEKVENPEIKEMLLSELRTLTNMSKKGFKNNFQDKMVFIEDCSDAINILNEKYLNLHSEPREFYKWLDRKNSWFADVLDGEKKSETTYRKHYASSRQSTMDYEKYCSQFDMQTEIKIPETFQNDLKLEAFRKFVDVYEYDYPEIINKIYTSEYLKTQPQKIRKIFQKIQKKYGTLVISSNANLTVNDAKYVEEELRLWKQAGKGNTILPKVINVDSLDRSLRQGNCFGSANYYYNKVKVQDLLNIDTNIKHSESTLRHEINHLNDKHPFQNIFDVIKWNLNKMLHENAWKKELDNAGIPKNLQDYALTEACELKSVTAESNMKKLSKKFKTQLKKTVKMQDWIFNLKDNKIRMHIIKKKKATLTGNSNNLT